MKNGKCLSHVAAGISLAVFIVLGVASATTPAPASGMYRPLRDFPGARTVEPPIEANFESSLAVNAANIPRLNEIAHGYLREEAVRRGFYEDITIVNITWQRRRVGDRNVFFARGYGTVFGEAGRDDEPGIESSLRRAMENIAESLPAGARIAITPMVDHGNLNLDRFFGPFGIVRSSTVEFLTGELEHMLVGRGFAVVTTNLDETHIAERRYWGFESDASVAARIGRLAGATVAIIIGTDGSGDLHRLRLRAVDTSTMQVIGTASERVF